MCMRMGGWDAFSRRERSPRRSKLRPAIRTGLGHFYWREARFDAWAFHLLQRRRVTSAAKWPGGCRMNLSCNSNEAGAVDEGRERTGAAGASAALRAGGAGLCRSGAGESDWRAYRLYGWVCDANGYRFSDGGRCERAG